MSTQESTPKFAVGEVVIVQCSGYPKHNGEQTVRGILVRGDIYFDRIAGHKLRTMPPQCQHAHFGYQMESILDDDDGFETIYDESALRKRQQPGELSFKEILEEHKEPA